MIPLASVVPDQIRFLLQGLNSSNSDAVVEELCQYTAFGVEESIILLRTCFDHLNINSNEQENVEVQSVLSSIIKYLLDSPNFSTVVCESLTNSIITEDFLRTLCDLLRLSIPERICIGLALSDSERTDVRICGKNFCLGQIMELCSHQMAIDSAEQIQQILLFLNRSEELSKHADAFMRILSLVQLNDQAQFVLSPILSDEFHEANYFRNLDCSNKEDGDDFDCLLAEMDKEISIADVMKDLGYGCTASVSQCKEMLSLVSPLNEPSVARILATISRTHVGLDDNQNVFSAFQVALGRSSLSDISIPHSWNAEVLIDSIRQLAPGINWGVVFENLDHEGFYIPNEEAFLFFMSIYKHVGQDPFPLHVICGSVWENVEGQLSFLKNAVAVPPEVFTFAHSGRQLGYMDAVNEHKLQLETGNHAWLCLDLLEILCLLAEKGHANAVRTILQYPLKHCPEILLLGMAHIKTAYNLIQSEVSLAVFTAMLKTVPGSGMISHLWHVNPSMLLWGFVDALNADQDHVFRILDVCQEFKIVSQVLDMLPSFFSIRLAAVASAKEIIDLEKWLFTNLTTYRDSFFEDCLRFLKEVQIGGQEVSENRFQPSTALWSIYSESSSIFLKVLQSHAGLLSAGHLYEELEKLQVSYMRAIPRSKSTNGADSVTVESYADDVEAEANSYFHQMFSSQLAVEAMVQMLTRFKESLDRREKSIYECMIANLFEEYKFFSKYPEKQLKIAAVLFGSLIKHQLVTHITLGIALRAVLDALRKPADSKMFVFGTKALEQFLDRLIEWPQYCNHILQISHIRATHPDLVSFIERALARISGAHVEPDPLHAVSGDQHGLNQAPPPPAPSLEMPVSSFHLTGSGASQQGQQGPSPVQLSYRQQSSLGERKISSSISNYLKPTLSSAALSTSVLSNDASAVQKPPNAGNTSGTVAASSGFVRPPRTITSAKFGSALNIETLVAAAERRETPIEAPPSEVQDKISFIVNNLSASNVEAKAKEFTEILNEMYYPWFAQYMVMKRTSIEPNFHDLYLKFLDKVNSKLLNKEVLQATYENCKVLLGSELIKSSSEERSLLKNLGSWLGKITIGRNQVLRAREIDPKALIIEAYEKGLMIAVIPFTSKVMEPCQSSIAYRPPNPWTMAILGLLAEIYAMPNLKMNLKFEIEVLYKNLGVDMNNVSPTSLLKDRQRAVEGNPDFSNKDVGSSQQTVSELKSSMVSNLNQVEIAAEVAVPLQPAGHSRVLPQYAAPLHVLPGTQAEDEKLLPFGVPDHPPSAPNILHGPAPFSTNQLPATLSNIEQQVIVNTKLHAWGLHLPFQSVLTHSMDRAIKEIVPSVVKRSVSIATQTTKELVLKDYAMEMDENRIRNAAHLMVASLAGSLAHVTCKEPLRNSISNQLRNSLQGLNFASDLLEQAILMVTNDNLDLGCALIEQAATDKAIKNIDDEMTRQLIMRRKHREGVGPTFFDANMYAQSYMGALPEALRPKPGRLSLSQQRVYEDFVRLPWQNQSSQSFVSAAPSATSTGGISRGFLPTSGQMNPGLYLSGVVNAPVGSVAQPLDISLDDIDLTAQVHSGASGQVSLAEGALPRNLDNENIVTPFPSLSTEFHSVEPSLVVQESAAVNLNQSSASESQGVSVSEPLLTTGDVLDKYQMVSEKLESLLTSEAEEAEIQGIIAEVPAIILHSISREEAALAVAQKAFKALYENSSNSACVSSHLAILAAIRDVSKPVVKELTSWVLYSDDNWKFNKDITVGLIRSELLNLAEYNVQMSKIVDSGRNKAATDFAISLIHTLVISASWVIPELQILVDTLAKLASRPESPESLQQLIEIAKNPTADSSNISAVSIGKDDNSRLSRDKKGTAFLTPSREDYNSSGVETVEPDSANFQDQVTSLFAEWYRICDHPVPTDAAIALYVSQLQKKGLLKGDDTTDRFFRRLTEISVSHCLSTEVASYGPSQLQPLSFLAIDMYANLVYSILKFFPVDQGSSRLFILPKVLAVTVKFIHKDAEEKKMNFNPRPYFRLFVNWIFDLCSLDPVFDGANFQVLTALANAFHALQPLKVPAFSFAWLELVSQKSFMPKLLTGNAQKGWPYFQRLLVDLFLFMEPFLRNADLGESIQFLYKGTLTVLLVLLHDFPEFLCDYHFSFCDVIPPSCIQMRNIILSAFPRNMRLPDPSTPNLKIDLLAEIHQSPRILSEIDAALKAKQMKNDVDEYLKTRAQSSFLSELKLKLLLPSSEATRAGTRYNVPLINSLVLYVGVQAIQQLQARNPPQSTGSGAPLPVTNVGAALDIFQMLIMDLDTEGRYLFLNAIANQLRYPNNHTHYFSFILLYLFAESNQETIQEQITRVLLERLIVNRPHPWGLLITFIELIKNSRYNFWSRSFTRCAPEIEKLFESVSRSCGGSKTVDESVVSGGIPDNMH